MSCSLEREDIGSFGLRVEEKFIRLTQGFSNRVPLRDLVIIWKVTETSVVFKFINWEAFLILYRPKVFVIVFSV